MEKLTFPFQYFDQPQQRIYWLYLATAFLFASLPYMIKKSSAPKGSYPGLFSYLFPQHIYLHKSAINDYLFFFTNTLLMALLITPFFSFTSINVANLVNYLLSNSFPLLIGSLEENHLYLAIGLTLLIGLLSDFAIFFVHYLQHRVSWLWEFHKVHHSAEVLTPLTVYRMHPMDTILNASFTGLFIGAAIGVLQFIFKTELPIFNIAGTNLTFIFFYLCAYNLRHSHIWLSYGGFFNRIFISPAQHQIHHSSDSKHFNQNMGFIFAFWDSIFGTLYVPKQKESLRYGINQHENTKFNSFWSLYLMPFINIINNFKFSRTFSIKHNLSVIVFATIVGSALYFSNKTAITPINVESIFLEEMTWQEIRDAVSAGKNKVIVPTAGVEQNGPHMILGKHNHIVRYTSARIAEKVKNTLVSPVMNYVPEGTIDPPEGHMRFAGTLSISDHLFAEVLKSTANSLKSHGFKTIIFIGDSGGNQAIQNQVAEQLTDLWSSSGIRVIHIGNYYSENGQTRYLLNKGFSPAQIGNHAGIRDTSELLAIYPQGIRSDLIQDNSTTVFLESGADGDANKARSEIGEVLLDLKINAAVKQIKSIEH